MTIRFSLRTVFVGVTVVCILVAGITRYLVFHEHRLQAIAQCEAYSSVVGPVGVHIAEADKPDHYTVPWYTPARYRRAVRNINLVGTDDGSDSDFGSSLAGFDFGLLRYFPELEILSILGYVHENQLLDVPSLNKLYSLRLQSNGVTDKAICHLVHKCPNIVELEIDSNNISDGAFDYICRLRQLRHLQIALNGGITTRALLELRGAPKLQELIIRNAQNLSRGQWHELKRALPVKKEYE